MMDLIQQLTESKLFPSKTAFRSYTGRELAELAYMHICVLRILSLEPILHAHVRAYAKKTARHNDFEKFEQGATDLYMLLNALVVPDREVKGGHDFINSLHIDQPRIRAWLQALSASNNKTAEQKAQRLFVVLDNNFKETDHALRAVRRHVMNWTDLDHHEKEMVFTRLLQRMRAKAKKSDLFFDFDRVAKNNRLEAYDDDVEISESISKKSSLATVAQMIRNGYLAEDDGAVAVADSAPSDGVTTSADIASVVKPLMRKVRRRK